MSNLTQPSDMTFVHYRNEVVRQAEMIVNEAKVHDDFELHDRVTDTVDNHEWIIYNGYPLMILMYTDNSNAYFEIFGNQLGELDNPTDDDITRELARPAFERDIWFYLNINHPELFDE